MTESILRVNNIENINKFLYENKATCVKYSLLHTQDSQKFSELNTYLNIANIIITAISSISITTTNSVTSISPTVLNASNAIFAIVLGSSTIINSMQQWANYEKQAELHRTASEKYAELANNINSDITLSEIEETPNSKRLDFLKYVTLELNKLLSTSPIITRKTIASYEEDEAIVKQHFCNAENAESSVLSMNNVDHETIVIPKTKQEISRQKKMEFEIQRFMSNTYNDDQ